MTDPSVVDPEHSPTPFTAHEIRLGCPAGRQVTVAHTSADGNSEYWTTTFVKADAVGAILVNQRVADDGRPLGGASEMVATWDELQAHASFPAANTTITEVEISTPIGEMSCLLYEVAEGSAIKRLWFARSLPGLPIKTVYEEDGVVRLTTIVVRDTKAEAPDFSD